MEIGDTVKIVVYVPESHAEIVREALGKAGAGTIGNYSYCSFSSKGVGRFLPETGAHPTIGDIGVFEAVPEERIEVTCERRLLQVVLNAMKSVHPYEEVAYDIYPLLTIYDKS